MTGPGISNGAVPASPSAPIPPNPPATGGRRWLWPALAVVVVALVVLAALLATGTIRFGGANSPPSPYQTFSQAGTTAQSTASSVAGGPWYEIFGAAVATPTAILEPTTNLSSFLTLVNCTFVWPGGEPANLGIPATGPSAAAGTAAFWVFGLKNASNGLLLESVSDGVALALLTATGGSCAEAAGYVETFPAGVVDSPAIVVAANIAGGSAFLTAHPNSTEAWGAYGGVSLGGFGSTSPVWYVEYTSCSLPTSVDETGAVFNATLGGTSGEVTASSTGTANCELTAPTGLSLVAHAAAPPAAVRKAI